MEPLDLGLGRRKFLITLGGIFVAAAAPTKTYAFFGNILRREATAELITPPMYSGIITIMTVTLNGMEMLKKPITLDYLSTDWIPKGDKIVYKYSPGDQGTVVYDPRKGTIAYIHTKKTISDLVLRMET